MLYDKSNKRIKVKAKEFVSISRRRFSPTLPFDIDEPRGSDHPKRTNDVGHSTVFTLDGLDYELICEDYKFEDGELNIERFIESSPDHPRKEEISQIRGEGYINAYVIASEEGLDCVSIAFTYVNIITGDCKSVCESVSFSRLCAFFDKCANAVKMYATPEIQRVTERVPSFSAIRFPYPTVREPQREFISSAYKTLARGGKLFASAPTGTGKTISAIYPAIRGLGDEKFDKIFYFTPKTTTAIAAAECLELLSEKGAKIKAIVLNAKDKCCRQGRICKQSKKLCKNAGSNKLAEAALELYNLGETVIDIKNLSPVSEKYSVCPYELSLTYAELCDVVICDFNYLFDPFVYIKRFFERQGRYAFLIDEAHNLAERVRSAYSASISGEEISYLGSSTVLGEFSAVKKLCENASEHLSNILLPLVKEDIRELGDSGMRGATHLSSLPDGLYDLILEITEVCEKEILLNQRASDEEKDARLSLLNEYYYNIKRFREILLRFDESYECFIFYDNGSLKVELFCLDTGAIIKERLSLGYSALLFSATLSPLEYYRATLGGDRSDKMLEVGSAFDPSQLSVAIMDKISTRFQERDDTLSAVIRVISATVSAKRGNYIVFSPSFAYCEALSKLFRAKYPKLNVITQRKNMTQKEKEEFLLNFKKEDKSYLIAFCVMGGIYAEGIDLAGESLIGAVIVGIGIPGLSYEREAIAAYYEGKYEEGKEFAYIYPGMNRVFQAAGRVIRREDDRGVIVLIDDRFDDPIYKKSLPALWEGVNFFADAKELKAELDEFWKNI